MTSPPSNNLFLILILQFFLIYPTLSFQIRPSFDNYLPPSLLSSLLSSSSSIQRFINIRNFGARNDGKTDATNAFLNAWDAACSSMNPSIIYVPKGEYLLKPLQFEGNCKSSKIVLQIDGTLVAPNDYEELANENHWIMFHMVNGLHIKGGVLDAKGKYLWNCKTSNNQQCPDGAKTLGFDNSKNIFIDGLTSIDSQMFHVTINACQYIKITRMTITADANSPNTDGIHISSSSGVTILDSTIKTGDDCISMGPNNQNIWIERIFCGPGHGISIGSLGRDKSEEGKMVQNVMVKSVTFAGTSNGLRIKTFSTPIKGRVKDIFFLGAHMNNVQNPIIIDQKYCPHNSCPYGQGSGIQIDNIVYRGIRGTSASETALTFECSSKKPCVGLTLQDVKLTYQNEIPQCESENAYGKVIGFMHPSNCIGQ